MNKTKFFSFTVSLLLTLAFIFSCAKIDDHLELPLPGTETEGGFVVYGSSDSGEGDNSSSSEVGGASLYCDFGLFNQHGGGCFAIENESECDITRGEVRTSCPHDQYCDFGPVNQYGGGCIEIDDANDCDMDWGILTNACGSKVGYINPGSECLSLGYCWWLLAENSSSSRASSSSTLISSSSSSVQLGLDPRPTTQQPMTSLSALQYLSDVKAGWNMGNTMDAVNSAKTLAVETAWGNPAATQTLLNGVKAQGFDIVRIGCTWIGHIGPAPDYIVSEARLQRVAEIVNMVHNAGMKAIINIHHDGNYTEPPNTWGFLKFAEVGRGAADNEQVKDQLSKVWTQIANYFKNYGDDLIFETMNEVHSGNWGNGVSNTEQDRLFDWNKTALDAIRATGDNNAKRFVAVPTLGSTEPGMVIAAHNRNKLLPSDLGNGTSRLIVSVHFYAPWQYTVADVTGQGGEGRNTITTAELNAIDTEAARIKSTFINNGIAVYYGEWGAPTNVRATMSETIKSTHINYIGRVASATKANGIVPIIWDDGGDFKMLERSNGTPKTGLWKDVRDAYINATGTTSSGSSSSGSSSSSSSSGGGGTGNYCNYGICTTGWDEWTCIGGGGCYPMPTDDYCASGTLVVSCPAGSVPPMGSW